MAPRRDRSGSFQETMRRRRATLDSEIERPPLAFVRKGSAGSAIGETISGGLSATANPLPPRQQQGPRRPTVTGAGRRPTPVSIRRLSHQHGEYFLFSCPYPASNNCLLN